MRYETFGTEARAKTSGAPAHAATTGRSAAVARARSAKPPGIAHRLFASVQRITTPAISAKRNFILQLGFDEPAPAITPLRYAALTFQPRVVLATVVAGILFQSQAVFAALWVALWWSALFPELSLFNALYNRTFGRRSGAIRLGPSPAPRRAAETEAGTIALTIALLIHAGFGVAAYAVEGILLAAALAVRFGAFCTGAFIFHMARGNWKFALKTLPWAG